MTIISGIDTLLPTPRIAVIATCHNRRDVTLAGLRALPAAFGGLNYAIYLCDDGCTDGTGDAVRKLFPAVHIIAGDGSLFWNGGMRKAWQAAQQEKPDYYMWWNDDLQLLPLSIAALFKEQKDLEARLGAKTITIGRIVDPATGAITYGAYARRAGLSKLRFIRAEDGNENCATMNGNCVLLPASVTDDIGTMSERYRHSTGDVDFGLRASQSGYHIVQSGITVGYSAANPTIYSDRSARASLSRARYVFTNPKGVPFDEWRYFCASHGGWIWPVNFIYRYLRIFGIAR